MRYEMDGVHLWHPLMDGEPSVALSPKRYGSMALLRGHGRLPTLSYLRPKLGATSRSFVAELVTPVEGTTLLPHGFMDRRAGTSYGYAPAPRKFGLSRCYEGRCSAIALEC